MLRNDFRVKLDIVGIERFDNNRFEFTWNQFSCSVFSFRISVYLMESLFIDKETIGTDDLSILFKFVVNYGIPRENSWRARFVFNNEKIIFKGCSYETKYSNEQTIENYTIVATEEQKTLVKVYMNMYYDNEQKEKTIPFSPWC